MALKQSLVFNMMHFSVWFPTRSLIITLTVKGNVWLWKSLMKGSFHNFGLYLRSKENVSGNDSSVDVSILCAACRSCCFTSFCIFYICLQRTVCTPAHDCTCYCTLVSVYRLQASPKQNSLLSMCYNNWNALAAWNIVKASVLEGLSQGRLWVLSTVCTFSFSATMDLWLY